MLLPGHRRSLRAVLAIVAGAAAIAIAAAEPDPPIDDLLAQQRFEEALAPLRALEEEWSAAVRKDDSLEYRLGWARALLALGMVEDRLAKSGEALVHIERARQIASESESGPHFLGDCLDALGKAQHNAGRYAEAETSLLQAIGERRKPGPAQREPWLSASGDHLGLLYLTMGRYREAGRLFHRSLQVSGDDPNLLAQRHGYLGRYYHTLRSYALARDHLEQALAHAEKAWGRNNPSTINLIGQHGLAALRLGDLAQARASLSEAAALVQLQPASHQSSLNLATHLNNLGQLLLLDGDFEDARRTFKRALDELTPRLGEYSPALAPFWNNLGYAYQRLGQFANARKSFHQAAARYRYSVGTRHQRYLEANNNLVLNLLLEGNSDTEAAGLIREATTAALAVFDRLRSFGTERQRLNYLQRVDLLSLPCALGSDPELIANTLIHTKARLLDTLLTEEEEAEGLHEELRTLERRRDDLLFRSADREILSELQSGIEGLEQKMQDGGAAGPEASSGPPADWKKVRESLPWRSAFVDFVRFRDYRDAPEGPFRYGAILILPEGTPRWIPLATEAQLQTWAGALKDRLDYRAAVLAGAEMSPPPIQLRAALHKLHDLFWAPVAAALPDDTSTIGLCPDGALNFLSFAILLDKQDQFLAARYRHCVYLSSARDLLVEPLRPSLAEGPWTVAAVAEFEEAVPITTRDGANALDEVVLATIEPFRPVPGALKELKLLRRTVPPEAWGSELKNATEPELRGIAAHPAVLHLTTHGFFLPSVRDDALVSSVQDFDQQPERLYRAGLLLAEAKRALSERINGADIGIEEDGILYPHEAVSLPLGGTRLVTLSSCESGLGESLSGEGVLGLRRGFTLAGASNVLLTLWPVSDLSTPAFMERMYTLALATDRIAQPLWETQRRMLDGIPATDDDALEEAVLRYGCFVLCQRGPLEGAAEMPDFRKPVNYWWYALAGVAGVLTLVFLWPRKTRRVEL